MSQKVMDCCNRWRSKTVSFRMSPEEDALLDSMVRLSGMTKQDYITRRLLEQEIVVQGNPRVFKALRNQMAEILTQLQRIEAGVTPDEELLDVIRFLSKIMDGMKEDTDGR